MKCKINKNHIQSLPVKPPYKHSIEIRLSNDNVYDVFVDGEWVFSRTSYQNVLTELEKLFTTLEPST